MYTAIGGQNEEDEANENSRCGNRYLKTNSKGLKCGLISAVAKQLNVTQNAKQTRLNKRMMAILSQVMCQKYD